MKKILLLQALTCVVCLNTVHAQSAYASHYYAAPGGANGFRSVSEENAYMERVVAERKQKERAEEMMTEETNRQQVKHTAAYNSKMIAQAGSRQKAKTMR